MIVKILVGVGSKRPEGPASAVMEAMKMESEVKSPCAGTVLSIQVAVGETVQSSEPLMVIG